MNAFVGLRFEGQRIGAPAIGHGTQPIQSHDCPFVRLRTLEECVDDEDLIPLVAYLVEHKVTVDMLLELNLKEIESLFENADVRVTSIECLRLRTAIRRRPMAAVIPNEPEWRFLSRCIAAGVINGDLRNRQILYLEITGIAASIALSFAIQASLEPPNTCKGDWHTNCNRLMSIDSILWAVCSFFLFLSVSATFICTLLVHNMLDESLPIFMAKHGAIVFMPGITFSFGATLLAPAMSTRLCIITEDEMVAWAMLCIWCFGYVAFAWLFWFYSLSVNTRLEWSELPSAMLGVLGFSFPVLSIWPAFKVPFNDGMLNDDIIGDDIPDDSLLAMPPRVETPDKTSRGSSAEDVAPISPMTTRDASSSPGASSRVPVARGCGGCANPMT